MAKQSGAWVDEYGNDFAHTVLRDDFHAVTFHVNKKEYTFSGWWVLEWGDKDDECKYYDSKEEFLKDPIFDGKTIDEVEIKDPQFLMSSF
ncbi:MAG: hypothetical protein ACOX78_08525 [Lachnospiraceae bacterium]|jgi:hypothetical protein